MPLAQTAAPLKAKISMFLFGRERTASATAEELQQEPKTQKKIESISDNNITFFVFTFMVVLMRRLLTYLYLYFSFVLLINPKKTEVRRNVLLPGS